MAVGRANVIAFYTVVVGQLNFSLRWVALVTDKGQRVFVLWVFRPAQQLHAQYQGVKVNRALEIANAKHGV